MNLYIGKNSCGPETAGLGCSGSMKSITHLANEINKINEYYDKGLEILPSNEQNKDYNLIETEVNKIMIE